MRNTLTLRPDVDMRWLHSKLLPCRAAALARNELFFVLLSPQNTAFMVYYQVYRTDGSFSQPPFNRKGGSAMRVVFLMDSDQCVKFFPPIAGHGLYDWCMDILRRIHQKRSLL